MVMAMLFFSFQMFVRQSNAQAHVVHFGEVAHSLAESGANLAWRSIRLQAGTAGDPIRVALVEAGEAAEPGAELPLDLAPEVAEALGDLGPSADLEVSARVLSSRPVGDPADLEAGYEPLARRAVVEVVSRGGYRGVTRTVTERRETRVVLDALPVLPRFTLFVREPEVEGTTSPGYNLFANDIHGVPDTGTAGSDDNFLPLVLYNHGDAHPRLHHELGENGWVFLGGSSPVKLNLTSGADYRYGEYFHFYNFMIDEGARQPAFLSDSPPAFFEKPHPIPGGEAKFFLKHVIYGFFTVDRGMPPSDMNRDHVLARWFDFGGNMRSSSLHLFGSTLAPSPTRVFGEVYQAYPIYTGITVDVDGDGKRDGLVGLAPGVDEGGFDELPTSHPLPHRIRHLARPGEWIELGPGLVAWDRMFPDFTAYEEYQSTLVEAEPYNWSVDYIRSKGEFPIEHPALDPAKDYPNPGTEVTVRRRADPRGAPGSDTGVHFQGDLNRFQLDDLEKRSLLRYPDAASFLRAHLADGKTLKLGSHVSIAEGDLELPRKLAVEAGGILWVKGSIRFDGIDCAEGEHLVLVSRTGSITSEFAEADELEPAEVDLVALEGRVRATDPNRPLQVRGHVAARRFEPGDFQAGGRIVWDPTADPANPDRKRLARLHLADRAESWGL